MSLHCFFGLELRADGAPVTPLVPPNTSLVLTHCALTSTAPGALTLYAQSHEQPNRFAICTLSAEGNVFYAPLQLVFTQKVSFTLVASHATSKTATGSAANTSSEQCPTVHITGYFESEGDEQEDAADFDDVDDHMDDSEDIEAAGRKRVRSGTKKDKQQKQQAEEPRGKKKRK